MNTTESISDKIKQIEENDKTPKWTRYVELITKEQTDAELAELTTLAKELNILPEQVELHAEVLRDYAEYELLRSCYASNKAELQKLNEEMGKLDRKMNDLQIEKHTLYQKWDAVNRRVKKSVKAEQRMTELQGKYPQLFKGGKTDA